MPDRINPLHLLRILIYIHSVDIIFLFIKLSGVVSVRAAVIYDYYLIAILIAFRVPALITWIVFSAIFILDLLAQISSVFLFNVTELIRNLEFSFLYNLTAIHYFSFLILVGFLVLNYLIIKTINHSITTPSKSLITFFVIFPLIIYGLDTLNGDSLLNRSSKKIIPITKFNIGQSSIKNIGLIIRDFTQEIPRPEQITKSITFNTFETDSTTNQLLIIVESFGMPRVTPEWDRLKNTITEISTNKGWNVSIGSTPFKGSTTSSELRELLNLSGDYRYLLDNDSANTLNSIFKIKRKQKYHTIAAHSFSVQMFERQVWWKNIGIDSAIFLETIANNKKLSPDHLNYDTPFTSVNDEDAFNTLAQMAKPGQKVFAYLLTENTHLPFRTKIILNKDKRILNFESKLSEEGNNQIKRIQELLFFFINTIDKSQWSKVLIVGDHMPPFARESDLEFYSKHRVPFIILSEK